VTGQPITNDVLFTSRTFDLLLKLRFLLTNHRWPSTPLASSMSTSFAVTTATHRFLHAHTHHLRRQLPFGLAGLVDKIYASLCRLPVLDKLMRIPDTLWRTDGFRIEYARVKRSAYLNAIQREL
jgi:hypothetical protein